MKRFDDIDDTKLKSASDLLQCLFEQYKFFLPESNGTIPIPFHWEKGKGNFVLIVGENASGKSVIRRILCALAKCSGHEPIPISMQSRVEQDWSRAFIYGAENYESTGQISARTVTKGIESCRSRENTHIIFWDEPDLGLSDSWAAGMGVALRDFAISMPAKTVAAFVVTHNRELVRQLVPSCPHFVCLGKNHQKSIDAWINQKVIPRNLSELSDESLKLFRKISKWTKNT